MSVAKQYTGTPQHLFSGMMPLYGMHRNLCKLLKGHFHKLYMSDITRALKVSIWGLPKPKETSSAYLTMHPGS